MILILKKFNDYEDMDCSAERAVVSILTDDDFFKAYNVIQEDLKNMETDDNFFVDLKSEKKIIFEDNDMHYYCYYKDEEKEYNTYPYKTVEYFAIRLSENKVYSRVPLFFSNNEAFCYF